MKSKITHNGVLSQFMSLTKETKCKDWINLDGSEIFNLLLLKNQIEEERQKIIEEERKYIGSMKKYLSK